MTPDSLEAALRAVPMSCGVLPGENHSGHHACWPDYPAVVAAAREWMRQQLPPPEGTHEPEYNRAIADVVRWLGLEEGP